MCRLAALCEGRWRTTQPHGPFHSADARRTVVGMSYDRTLLDRRNALRILAGAGFVALAGCASSKSSLGSASTTTTRASTTNTTATTTDCTPIPEETAGPFPGDGSNGPDALHTD